MKLHLEGRTVIVTGGTKGIGRAIVEAFLEEGANVAYCARHVSGYEFAPFLEQISSTSTTGPGQSATPRAVGTAVDVGEKEAVEGWVTSTAGTFGGVDVIVSNVSALSTSDTVESWRTSFAVDMLGPVHLIAAGMPYLEKSADPAIVAIGSVSGHELDFTAPGPYGSLKAALAHYMQSLAFQLAPKGIRVNTVSPGNVYFEGGVWHNNEQNHPELFKRCLDLNPTGRMCRPREVATAVVFLASPVSSFTTGANLLVDGALTRGVMI